MVWRRGQRLEHEIEGDREIVEYGMEERRDIGIWCGKGQSVTWLGKRIEI